MYLLTYLHASKNQKVTQKHALSKIDRKI